MIWVCVSWHGVGTRAKVSGNVNAKKYEEILEDSIWPVIARLFADNSYIFQDDNAAVHHSRSVNFYKTRSGVKAKFWQALSPD